MEQMTGTRSDRMVENFLLDIGLVSDVYQG